MRRHFWKFAHSFDVGQIAIAIGIAILIIFTYQHLDIRKHEFAIESSRNERINEPASTWMEVYQLEIPDFTFNQDPVILYEREIKRDFFGRWSFDIEKVTNEGQQYICGGQGQANYEVGDELPSVITLSWFLYDKVAFCEGKLNEAGPGKFRIILNVEIFPTDPKYEGIRKLYKTYSNMFNVTEN